MSLEKATTFGLVCFVIFLTVFYSVSWLSSGLDIVYSTGIFVIGYAFMELLDMVKLYTSTKMLKPTKQEEWAIITGCTNGLGKDLAFDLASQGFNLLLISRNQELLESLEKDIKLKHTTILTKCVQHDFSNVDQAIVEEKIGDFTASRYVGVLVNNVGIANDVPDFYNNYDLALDYQLVDVNIKAQLMMTKILLPYFLKQKHGHILNISSGSAYNPCPYITTYGATKSFLRYWSNAMASEHASNGVKFYVGLPLFFMSNMVKEKESFLVPKSSVISKSILKHCLITNESCPYFPHWIQNFAMTYTPIPNFLHKVFTNIYEKEQANKSTTLSMQLSEQLSAEQKNK